MRAMRWWICGLVLIAVGCTNKLSGDVSVNNETLELDSCRSGVVYGFRGVEMTAKSGCACAWAPRRPARRACS
jgi:hypothetical protein